MSRIGSFIGEVTVGVSGSSPALSAPVQIETPAITLESKGRLVLSAGTTTTLQIFGGMGHAVLVQLEFTDESLGTKKDIDILRIQKGGGAAAACTHLPSMSDFIYSSVDTAEGLAGIQVLPGAGNDTVCKYVVAGVA